MKQTTLASMTISSKTYSNTQKPVTVPTATPKPVPVQTTHVPISKPVNPPVPSYQVQKNLAPTGMN